jgi:dephospho-CoA kinase
MTQEALERSLLSRYTKPICHLHYALSTEKLGLMLGAGVSNELKIPSWKRLLDAVEEQIQFDGKDNQAPESYRGEQLYQYFRRAHAKQLTEVGRRITQAKVDSDWRKMVSDILYRKFLIEGRVSSEKFKAAIDAHPYFRDLAKIAGNLELAISHNFDDALELAIATEPSNSRPNNRRYHAFWRPEPFLRQRMLNVYHPNGYIPNTGLKGSDSIILTESNFADLLANTNDAESSFLLSHLSYKTWLIIGHSLADGTLKNALRLHANRRPGHVSYFVHWVKDGEAELSPKQRGAIREANFATYNLVTLFLSSPEIGALLRLVNKSADDLHCELSAAGLQSRHVYYICGAVSSGKSTVLSHLRSMATIEEWPDRMPVSMSRPSTELGSREEQDIDAKLEDAIWRKNEEIKKIKVGLVAVDRAPLDFIAFPRDENESAVQVARKRHGDVLKRLAQNGFKDLCEGQVILVEADPETLLERQIQRGRRSRKQGLKSGRARAYLARQSNLMRAIYQKAIDQGSTVRGDGCSLTSCLQDVIRIIHFGDYRLFDFAQRLKDYNSGKP